jgi:hypothetical protein
MAYPAYEALIRSGFITYKQQNISAFSVTLSSRVVQFTALWQG